MLLTVKEYAEKKRISVQAVYKQIRTKNVEFVRKYGKFLIEYQKEKVWKYTYLNTSIKVTHVSVAFISLSKREVIKEESYTSVKV